MSNLPDYPQGPSSDTSGVVPLPIEGRFRNERERLAGGFTDEDRAWRKQWLKDQELHPSEPCIPPDYERQAFNPIRRWGRIPLDLAFKPLQPLLGQYTKPVRHLVGRSLFYVFGVYYAWYYAKYNSNDWTRRSGWKYKYNSGRSLPGMEGYPKLSTKIKESDYGTQMTNCPI